jgi:hypothetical protein
MMRRTILICVGLLALNVSASRADERAWLFWRREEVYPLAQSPRRPRWDVIRAFPSFVTCDQALEDTLEQHERIPRWEPDYQITGTRQNERMIYHYKWRGKGKPARGSESLRIVFYVCLPETIDPRID